MGLLQQASLVTTPNAVKAGKLYSIKPTNGAGDLDVVRATSATYVGSDGLIKTALANVPRLDYTNASCPSILVEPQRTNLCLQSEMFTQSPWISNATISANTNIAPDGTLTADTLTDSSTVQFRNVSQTISVSANSTLSQSVFIKKTTGTPTNYPSISVQFTGGGARVARLILNTTTGTFTISPDSTITPTGKVVSYNDYWRIEMTATDNGSNTSAIFRLDPAISSDGTTISASATGSAVFWGSQFEVGSNATSYIPTTTTSVTRNDDVISKSGVSSLIGQTEGSVFIDFIPIANNSAPRFLSLSNSTGIANGWILICGTSIQDFRFVADGFDFVTTVKYVLGQRYKVVLSYKNGVPTNMFINGVNIGTRTANTTGKSYNFLQLSFAPIGNLTNAIYNSIVLFPTVLTDSQAIQLTTL